jgi:hypothetical protein
MNPGHVLAYLARQRVPDNPLRALRQDQESAIRDRPCTAAYFCGIGGFWPFGIGDA